jgi:hypothetical protein
MAVGKISNHRMYAMKHGVSEGNISRWLTQHVEIFKLAAHVESAKLMGVKNRALVGNRKKQSRLLIGGPGVQFVEDAVNKGIMDRRRRFLNLPVVEQLAKKALREWVEAHGDVVCGGRVFQASKTWCRHFLFRKGLVSRRRSRKRPTQPAENAKALQKFLHLLRSVLKAGHIAAPLVEGEAEEATEVVLSVRKSKRRQLQRLWLTDAVPERVYTSEWGRFELQYRFNADSVPVTLEHLPRRTWVDHNDRLAQVPGLASEEKRFCTMHLCMHPMPSTKRQQPSPALIFRGQGHTATMIAERESYHPNVKVFWQENAWLTTAVCEQWADEVAHINFKICHLTMETVLNS